MKPLLSICIPTYNRAHYLKECLDSIVCQFDDKDVYEKVEIVISDNSDSNETEEMIKKYQINCDNINYFHNKKNIGFDLNLFNAIKKANGKYCWELGDDDLVKNGAIKFIIDILKEEEIVVLTMDFKSIINRRDVLNEILPKEIFKRKDNGVLFFDSYKEFMENGNVKGIFSIFIFNKELWLSAVDKKDFIIDWLYYETILKILPQTKLKFCYLNYPLIYLGQDCKVAKNGGDLISFLRIKRLFEKAALFGYDPEVYNKTIGFYVKQFPRGLPFIVLRAKSHNLKCSFSTLRLLYREFYKSPFYSNFYLFLATILFFIPNQLLKIARNLKKKIFQ